MSRMSTDLLGMARRLGFALRTSVASLVALYLAFLMNLDNPKWAAMTVWIVAQGSRGASLSKSQYRIVGTLVGGGVAVALTGSVAQTPELFIPALGLWLAICTGVASGLRNFRAYGAVLAGYTAVIVSLDAVNAPQNEFDIAIARIVYICLGIITEAVFTAIFAPGASFDEVRTRLSDYLRRTARVCAGALRGQEDAAAFQRLSTETLELDVAADYAAAASSSVRRRFGHFRRSMTAALAQMAAAQSLRERFPSHSDSDGAMVKEAANTLDILAQGQDVDAGRLTRLRSAVESEMEEKSRKPDYSLARLSTLYRLEALLGAAYDARISEERFSDESALPLKIDFGFHLDPVAAMQNGMRSFVALVAGSTLWIMTAWPSGSGFVTILCVVCALFATRPNPLAGGIEFLKGTAAAILAAGLCNFALLPLVTDFTPMAIVIGLVMLGTGLAMRNKRLAAPATSFAFLFLDLLNLDNRGRVDASAFLNGAEALFLGVAGAVLVFTLVFPTNFPQIRERLKLGAQGDLKDIGRAPARWTKELWLSKTADRLARQALTSRALTTQRVAADMRTMLAMLTIGNAAISLSRLAGADSRLKLPLAVVLRRLASGEELLLGKVARQTAVHLTARVRQAGISSPLPLVRAAVLLQELSEAVSTSLESRVVHN